MRAPERLPDSGWLRAEPLAGVLNALNGDGVETRVVGGAVRNAMLGLSPGDVDLATTASPDVVSQRARAAGMKPVPTGVAHGTVTVVAQGRAYEVTTLRRDVETHGRHATVAFGADWEADARRRDFTMNALYAAPDGILYDPVGGYSDLEARRVRFIGDAHERIREDYLRSLRFFRFHAQYGEGVPDAEGVSAIIKERYGLLSLSGERIRQELLRLLVAPGGAAALEVMADTGLLGILLAGVSYGPSFRRLTEIESALGLRPDPLIRLAALAVVIPEDALRLTARLRLSNSERDRLVAMAGAWRDATPALSETERRELLYRTGPEDFSAGAMLGWARSGAGPSDDRWRVLATLPERWTAPAFPLSGGDLLRLGVPAGPELGRLLAGLEREWIEEGFMRERDNLIARARERLHLQEK